MGVQVPEELLKEAADTCCETIDRRAGRIWARSFSFGLLGAEVLGNENVRAQIPG